MNKEQMFFTIRYDDSIAAERGWTIIEAQCETIDQAYTLMTTEYPDLLIGSTPLKATEDSITTCYTRAECWRDSMNDEQRCDELASRRFEEMAYGFDD